MGRCRPRDCLAPPCGSSASAHRSRSLRHRDRLRSARCRGLSGGQNGSSSNITDAWQMLGASELHRLQQVQSIDVRDILPMVGEKYAPACSIVKKPLSSLRQYVQMHISPVLFKNAIGKALRAVYREFKVSKLTWKYLNRIRMLLCRLQYGSAGNQLSPRTRKKGFVYRVTQQPFKGYP